jgi:NAD(P)-dependent dehydrogenase (short-subunit alcohol dehydrogenase family)
MNSQKTAIVTGAGKGMGAAIAGELKTRGYNLVLMSRTEERVMKLARKLDAAGIAGSVTEPRDLLKLVDKTLEKFGRIDAVVNSTGHCPKGELLELTDENWHSGLELVLLNVIRMARLVTPVMLKQGAGAIVNISTFAAYEPSPVYPVSSAIRAALGSFTKLFADRYAAENIRMNNILPGCIDSQEFDESVIAAIPMKRRGTVEEIAKTAAFLVSPESGYITGQNIRVDGGLTRSV